MKDLKDEFNKIIDEVSAKYPHLSTGSITAVVVLTALVLLVIALGISVLLVSGIVYFTCQIFGWHYAWRLALGIWLLWFAVKAIWNHFFGKN